MQLPRNTQLLILAMILAFSYVLFTEVLDRGRVVADRYQVLCDKQAAILDSASRSRTLADLAIQKARLTSVIAGERSSYSRSQTGAVEILTKHARKSRVRLESLVPVKIDRDDQLGALTFRLSVTSGFHEIASYINELESGILALRVRKFDLVAASRGGVIVRADVEGSVYIFEKEKRL